MSPKTIRQTMFTTGEVDVINWKRTDSKAYLSCAQSLLNMEVGTTGLAKKRRGTKFIGDVTGNIDSNSRLYEFIDQNDNYYILISADGEFNVFDISTTPITHVVSLSTPYTNAQLPFIDYSADGDVIVLAHPSYKPARIYISNYASMPYPTFAYQILNIYPATLFTGGPAYDFGNINYSGFACVFTNPTPSTFQLAVTGTGASSFNGDWIGGVVIGFGLSVNQPVGYGVITAVNTISGGVAFAGLVSIPFADPSDMPLLGSQYSIQQPSWSNTLGWPSKVLFYQNRLWFANTLELPNTIFGSKINNPVNFDVGTGAPTDAIVYTIGNNNAGGIYWLNGGKQLEIYAKNYDFVAPQQEAFALTPGTFSIRQQSAYGSSTNVKPTTYINDSYFISQTGNAIINFHFDGVGQAYTSTNVSVASSHLVKSPKNRALQQGTDGSQDNFIYYLNSDYSVTSFQFSAEHNLAALTPISFDGVDQTPPTGSVIVNDLVSINNTIYFLKNYTLSGISVIEIFEDTMPMEGSNTIIRLDGYITATMQTSGLITGLSQFNGYNVQIVYQNQDFGASQQMVGGNLQPGVVTGGQCYASNPNEDSGTVLVGLLYNVNLTPMYMFVGALGSNYYKDVSRIFVDYYNSLDFYVNGKLVNYQYYQDIQNALPLQPRTDTAIVSPVLGWNRFQTFSVMQSSPFDLQITSIAYQIDAAII